MSEQYHPNYRPWSPDPLSKALEQITNLKQEVADLKEELKSERERFVTKDEFNPVRAIAYSLVGLILAGVLGAMLSLVLSQNAQKVQVPSVPATIPSGAR